MAYSMDTTLRILDVAIPVITVAAAVFATAAVPLAVWLKDKRHNDRLARIVGACGRSAALFVEYAAKIKAHPDATELKSQAKDAALDALTGKMAESMKVTGMTSAQLRAIWEGERAKLPAVVTALPAFQAGETILKGLQGTTDAVIDAGGGSSGDPAIVTTTTVTKVDQPTTDAPATSSDTSASDPARVTVAAIPVIPVGAAPVAA